MPALALSRLVAAREVLHRFPSLLTKRQAIQAVRCHSDAHIARLFQLTFVSNFDDDQFIHAMQLAITRFGLVDAFADERPVLADGLIVTSRETCLSLLRLMDVALTLSEAPEDHFRLGGPSAESLYRVSLRSIEILARAHALLWSLPAAPLAVVLRFLARGCQQILSEMIAT